MESIIGNKEFEVPLIEAKLKNKKYKKEYSQYSLKIPKKMISNLNINHKCIFKFELLPIQKGQKYPELKVEVIRK